MGVPGVLAANTDQLHRGPIRGTVPLNAHEAVPGHYRQMAVVPGLADAL